jgi:hypothetical protein
MLCPNTGGLYKRTDDGKWAHVVCAQWVPEATFASDDLLEPILAAAVPRDRFRLVCVACGLRRGAAIQCAQERCAVAFHATCALAPAGAARGIVMAMLARQAFCRRHAALAPREEPPESAAECHF